MRTRPFRNKQEEAFRQLAERKGWRWTKRGWPDFFCLDERGGIVLVECKQHEDKLSSEQFAVMRAFMLAGIAVRTFHEGMLSEPLTPSTIEHWRNHRYNAAVKKAKAYHAGLESATS